MASRHAPPISRRLGTASTTARSREGVIVLMGSPYPTSRRANRVPARRYRVTSMRPVIPRWTRHSKA